MGHNIHIKNIAVVITSISLSLSLCGTTVSASHEGENFFLEKSNLQGGLIVHVGCGDGTLIAALGKNKQFVIQGLESDQQKLEKARQTIRDTGHYGRLSIRHWQGKRLPYVENLVNLLIIDDVNMTIIAFWSWLFFVSMHL